MIQPVNTLTPRATFRGNNKTYGNRPRVSSESSIALINAGGVATAAGGITTAIARAYTSSWPQAMVLGLFGSALTLFFMTPHLIEKLHQNKIAKVNSTEILAKSESQKISNAMREYTTPLKKIIQFKAN